MVNPVDWMVKPDEATAAMPQLLDDRKKPFVRIWKRHQHSGTIHVVEIAGTKRQFQNRPLNKVDVRTVVMTIGVFNTIGEVQGKHFHAQAFCHFHGEQTATASRVKYRLALELLYAYVHSLQEQTFSRFNVLTPIALAKAEHFPLEGKRLLGLLEVSRKGFRNEPRNSIHDGPFMSLVTE